MEIKTVPDLTFTKVLTRPALNHSYYSSSFPLVCKSVWNEEKKKKKSAFVPFKYHRRCSEAAAGNRVHATCSREGHRERDHIRCCSIRNSELCIKQLPFRFVKLGVKVYERVLITSVFLRNGLIDPTNDVSVWKLQTHGVFFFFSTLKCIPIWHLHQQSRFKHTRPTIVICFFTVCYK